MQTSLRRHRVAIIGGGITGLSAAWALQKAGVDYVLIEAADRLGGKVLTERVSGYVIEAGPDSFLTQKPAALALARELGLGDELIPINARQPATYVLHGGKPVPLPEGMSLIVPTKIAPLLRSPLLSPLGKARMLLEPLISSRMDDADESLADFVRRRFGAEALDKLGAPLMAGIHNADAERQSLLATFPRYREMERKGSLIRAIRGTKPGGQPAFMTLKGGTQCLIEALARRLTGELRLGAVVASVTPLVGAQRAAPDGGYVLTLDTGEEIEAEAVLITIPAHGASELLRPVAREAADALASIRYLSSGTISLAYRTEDVTRPLGGDGFGVLIPASEARPINAITVTSSKFDGRAPDGHVLLRVFFGGSRTPETMRLDDAELLTVVRAELKAILGIEAAPLLHRIFRWWEANPQYDVGHLERVAALEAALPSGLLVAGSAYRGVGLPDCIQQGQSAAQNIIEQVKERA